MINSTAVSSVRTTDPRGITAKMTNKTPGSAKPAGKTPNKPQMPSGQNVKANADKSLHGALTDFRHGVDEFKNGVLRPETGLVGEKLYETSASQTMENLRKKHAGALKGFYNEIHGFAFGILRPETGVIGEKTYDSSNSMTLDNLSKVYIGAAAGIKNTLREYVRTAVESTGPPVSTVEPIKVLQHEAPETSSANMPQNTQHVNMTV